MIASKARALERLTGRTPPLLFGALAAEFKSQPANYRSEGELTFSDKEEILATELQTFLDATPGAQQDAPLRSICSTLERLLGQRLQLEPDWSRYAWIDGIISQSAVVDPPDTLSIWGMAICMDGDRGGGSEPFAAKLEIADDGSSLRSYAMWFGDADAGLGRSDKRYRRRLVRDDPPRWLFEFRSPAA